MLRGVTGLIVPDSGALVFDIPKPQSLLVVKDASGGMMSADRGIARDQVMADITGRFSVRERTDSGFQKPSSFARLAAPYLARSSRAVYTRALSVPPGARPH